MLFLLEKPANLCSVCYISGFLVLCYYSTFPWHLDLRRTCGHKTQYNISQRLVITLNYLVMKPQIFDIWFSFSKKGLKYISFLLKTDVFIINVACRANKRSVWHQSQPLFSLKSGEIAVALVLLQNNEPQSIPIAITAHFMKTFELVLEQLRSQSQTIWALLQSAHQPHRWQDAVLPYILHRAWCSHLDKDGTTARIMSVWLGFILTFPVS